VSVSEPPLVDAPALPDTASAVGTPGVDDASDRGVGVDEALDARPPSTARVLAVLVAHDGEPYLQRTLDALAAQTHEHLEVVAVDNGSGTTRAPGCRRPSVRSRC
jgi:hypothetical protein